MKPSFETLMDLERKEPMEKTTEATTVEPPVRNPLDVIAGTHAANAQGAVGKLLAEVILSNLEASGYRVLDTTLDQSPDARAFRKMEGARDRQ